MRVLQKILYAFFLLYLLLLQLTVYSQDQHKQDTPGIKKTNIFLYAMKAITTDSASAAHEAVLNVKNEIPFLPYEGKGIRSVVIRVFGFKRDFTDTSLTIENKGKTFLEHFHTNTREWIIRDNLFFTEKKPLNAYVMADNERHLRSLSFIQDVRILVQPVTNEPDSVDIIVVTKDLFSITGEIDDLNSNRIKGTIGDVNVAGNAQSFFVSTLWENGRSPMGYQLHYSRNNLLHSFVNATVAYSTINPNLDDGTEDEQAIYGRLERPLVSQYSHVAGGLTLAKHKSANPYGKPDSLYYKYNYSIVDAWIGYNLGVKGFISNNRKQDKKFVSIRFLDNHFSEQPYQSSGEYDFRYDNKKAILGQFTFFRQQFYKTNYIYGFGSTEDMPYGYNVALTGGWFKQADLNRPYAGVNANRYVYTGKGAFIQYFLQAGSFFYKGNMNDATLLIGAGMFSRIVYIRDIKLRQYLNISYTRLYNRLGLDPLGINNPFGLRYFSSDSATGDRRLSLHTETNSFLNYKILGFKMGPFAFADMCLLTPENESLDKTDAYWGFGGGVRTRNEDLVFGTIELRFAWFPRKIDQNAFKITLTGNIRFRYNSSYVKAPDIVQVNSDKSHTLF